MRKVIVRHDGKLALLFSLLSIAFIVAMFNTTFFDWAFTRHQNIVSWYIRPLFLIPFGYFAYFRSLTGIFATLFLLLTSMFWFPAPQIVDGNVVEFLQMEKDYLTSNWTVTKIVLTSLIPLSLGTLAVALWMRSLYFGIGIVIFMAVSKVLWSVAEAGDAGFSILVPALAGLVLFVGLIYFGLRKLESSRNHVR